MADIVLDANALILLLNSKYVDQVIKMCDHIFISKSWKRIYRGIPVLQHGFPTLMNSFKKLYKKKKIHEVSGKANLPNVIERELRKVKASADDFEISRIAYDRKIRGQDIYLVSDDFHILRLCLVFKKSGIYVEKRKEELKRLHIWS